MVGEDWLVEQMCTFLKHTPLLCLANFCLVLFAPCRTMTFLPICDVFSGGCDFETRQYGSVEILVGVITASRDSCSYTRAEMVLQSELLVTTKLIEHLEIAHLYPFGANKHTVIGAALEIPLPVLLDAAVVLARGLIKCNADPGTQATGNIWDGTDVADRASAAVSFGKKFTSKSCFDA